MNEASRQIKKLCAVLCGLAIFATGPFPTGNNDMGFGFVNSAWADDDGDDGGGDDGDDGGDGGDGGDDGDDDSVDDETDDDDGPVAGRSRVRNNFNSRSPGRQSRTEPRRVSSAPAPQRFARAELVGRDLTPAALARLTRDGYVVLEQATLGEGRTIHRLRIPKRLTLTQARSRVIAEAPQAAVDLNHYYRPNAGDACSAGECLARQVIGWTPAGQDTKSCSSDIRIGMIDTAINEKHDALAGSRIEVKRLTNGEQPASGRQHGTAVAALLVGNPTGRSPGLLPGAELIAVDTFHRRSGQGDISDVYSLVKALDFLESRQVAIINMSLTGPANDVLERVVKRLSEKGIVLVAAAGNDGPKAKPVYPAAYAEVVAVTAVDRQKRPYRRAVRGPHIDLAAPGVDVWIAASVQGARPRTGTSFAAPFVTAAIALARQSKPDAQTDEVLARLTMAAEDLGAPGRDDVFGWGLLNPKGLCG